MKIVKKINFHFKEAYYLLNDSFEFFNSNLSIVSNKIFEAIIKGCKIFSCGNGGSSSDSQHFITELIVKLERDRLPISGINLSLDPSIITSISNDYNFDYIFQRQIESLGSKNDIIICLSTSGKSKNIIKAISSAKKKKMFTIILTGIFNNKINKFICEKDIYICLPFNKTMRIQEIHMFFLHILCYLLDIYIFKNIKN